MYDKLEYLQIPHLLILRGNVIQNIKIKVLLTAYKDFKISSGVTQCFLALETPKQHLIVKSYFIQQRITELVELISSNKSISFLSTINRSIYDGEEFTLKRQIQTLMEFEF